MRIRVYQTRQKLIPKFEADSPVYVADKLISHRRTDEKVYKEVVADSPDDRKGKTEDGVDIR